MSGLSAEDREAFELVADWTGHVSSRSEFNPACGTCAEIRRRSDALAETVEAIVARRVTAALTEAADAIEAAVGCQCTDSYCSARNATTRSARIVRGLVPPP